MTLDIRTIGSTKKQPLLLSDQFFTLPIKKNPLKLGEPRNVVASDLGDSRTKKKLLVVSCYKNQRDSLVNQYIVVGGTMASLLVHWVGALGTLPCVLRQDA